MLPEGLEIINVINSTGNYNQDTNVWTVGPMYPNQFAYLIIETKAVKAGNLTNHAVVSTTSNETNLENNKANATVIVEGDEPSTDKVNETQENDPNDPVEEPKNDNKPETGHDVESSNETGTSNEVIKKPDDVVSKSIGSATGNPILLALIALLLVSANIFRRKK